MQSANVTFRNNFVHHNLRDGIWYDSNTSGGALIEGNRVEDNGRIGIAFEASIGATIRNNTVRRNAGDAVFISMSQNAQIYNNSLEANFRGHRIFPQLRRAFPGGGCQEQCGVRQHGRRRHAERRYANAFSATSSCTSTQLAPYLNGSKNLTFSRDAYRVPSVTGRYLLWGDWKYWSQWQALGHDLDGSMSQ